MISKLKIGCKKCRVNRIKDKKGSVSGKQTLLKTDYFHLLKDVQRLEMVSSTIKQKACGCKG